MTEKMLRNGDLWLSDDTTDPPSQQQQQQQQPTYIAINLLPIPQDSQPRPPPEAPPAAPAPISKRKTGTRSSGGCKRGCCVLFEATFLLPLLLLACGVVLLPSGVYFIPRDLLLNASYSSEQASTSSPSPSTATALDNSLNCSLGFFHNSSLDECRPSCEEFSLQESVGGYSTYRIVVMTAGALACASVIVFMMLAVAVKGNTIFSFPRVYSIYICVTGVAMAIVLLIGAVRTDFYCNSEDLIINEMNSTLFCTISGVFFSYASLQQILWVTFQSMGLLYMAALPRHFVQSERAGHLRLMHSVSVVTSSLVPVVPALIHLQGEGFRPVGMPPILCIGRNVEYLFYSLALPLSVFSVIPTVAGILTKWTLLKRACGGVVSTELPCTVQLKTSLVITYSVIMGLSLTSWLMYYFIFQDTVSQELSDLFACESVSGQDCSSTVTGYVEVFQILQVTCMVLLLLLPSMILFFNLESSCCSTCTRKSHTDASRSESVQSFFSDTVL